MREAAWTNGKSKINGRWSYQWAANRFVVVLNSRDRITGEHKRIEIAGDTPEWGNWKLVKP